MEWVILGGICVALVVFGFVKHVHYVAKNVWAMRRAFDKPTRALPPMGEVVTINGIVSSIGEGYPVQLKMREDDTSRGPVRLKEPSRVVEAHPFALLLPEVGARVMVEPGDDVRLRAVGNLTDWEECEDTGGNYRFRMAALEDGDQALVTGVLSEKREVEARRSEYRSQKGNVRVEYVLRPIPGEPLRIDSATMLDEIQERFGSVGLLRGAGTLILVPAYVHALLESFSSRSTALFAGLLFGYAVARVATTGIERVPWFDRTRNLRTHNLRSQRYGKKVMR